MTCGRKAAVPFSGLFDPVVVGKRTLGLRKLKSRLSYRLRRQCSQMSCAELYRATNYCVAV